MGTGGVGVASRLSPPGLSQGRIDAHHHVFDRARFPQTWIDASMDAIDDDFSIADLAPLAAAAGVTGSILVQTVPVPDETPHFLDLALESELVTGVVGWCDLEQPDVADRIAELKTHPGGAMLVGIRHPVQDEADPAWLDRPAVRNGVAAVGAAGLVYELLVTQPHWDAAARLVGDLAEVTFVLDHLGKPPLTHLDDLGEWSSAMHALSAFPNVSAKLSGLVTEADWATWSVADLQLATDTVWPLFGPERLMFGSDWPVCRLAATYAEWVAAVEMITCAASVTELDDFFGRTARRVYGVDQPGGAP